MHRIDLPYNYNDQEMSFRIVYILSVNRMYVTSAHEYANQSFVHTLWDIARNEILAYHQLEKTKKNIFVYLILMSKRKDATKNAYHCV